MLRHGWFSRFLAVLCCVGCGPRIHPTFEKTVPVHGTVVFANGAPVRGGQITFHNQDPAKGKAWGTIGKDGRFELGTYKKDDGAMPGTYTVTVEPLVYDQHGNLRPNRSLGIPAKYTSVQSSGLTKEVKDEGGQEMKLILR